MKKLYSVILRHKSPLLLAFSFAAVLVVGPMTPVKAQRTPSGLLDRADRFFQVGNYDASATEYQRFLFFVREHPAAYYAHYRLGLAEYHLGRFEEATRAFRQSAQSSTASPNHRRHTRYQLGLSYLEAGQLDQAKLEILRLVLSPRDTVLATQASLIAGLAYAFQDRWEQANEMWQRTVALQKDNEPFQRKIAQAQAVATVHDKSQAGLQNRTGLTAGSTDRDSNRDLCQPQTRLLCCTQVRSRTFSPDISTGTLPA